MLTLTMLTPHVALDEAYRWLRKAIWMVRVGFSLNGWWSIECDAATAQRHHVHAHLVVLEAVDGAVLKEFGTLIRLGHVDVSPARGRPAVKAVNYLTSYHRDDGTMIPPEWKGRRLCGAFGICTSRRHALKWVMARDSAPFGTTKKR